MESQGNIDISEFLKKIKSNWYIFSCSLIAAVGIAIILIWYLPKKYEVSSKVKVSEEANMMIVENLIDDVNMVQENKNISNEIGVLKSYNLIYKTLKSLDFKVFYFDQNKLRSPEIYKSKAPFSVRLDSSVYQMINLPIEITFLSPSEFIVKCKGKDVSVYHFENNDFKGKHVAEIDSEKTMHFGEHFNHENLKFRLIRNDKVAPVAGQQFSFVINDLDQLSEAYSKRLNVNTLSRDASILELKLKGTIPSKEIDFLDRLVLYYINQNYTRKNQIAINTIGFIDRQLAGISDSLNNAEISLQQFRTFNNVLDLSYESKNYIDELKALEEKNANELIKSEYYDYLVNNVISNSDLNQIIAPSVMGIQDLTLNNLINSLSVLESEKTTLKYVANEKNPKFNILQENLNNVKKAIVENVNNLKVSSQIRQDNNNARIDLIKTQISQIPRTETILQKAQRKFDFNDNIFNFLLQKRTEAAIIKESNLPNDIIIDKAQLIGITPVSPNKKVIFAGLIVVAIFGSLAFIVLKDLLTNKVVHKKDITNLTDIPIISEISHRKNGKINGVLEKYMLEDFRALGIKIGHKSANKFIGLLSENEGEGKSFCALNLAKVLAKAGKKTLLVDANLTKPFLHDPLSTKNNLGLQNYLPGTHSLDEVIHSTNVENLFLVPSGETETTAMDIMVPSRLKPFFEEIRHGFDHVILDTEAMSQSADYLAMKKMLDLNLFVVRENHTTNELKSLKQLESEGDSEDGMMIIYNGSK